MGKRIIIGVCLSVILIAPSLALSFSNVSFANELDNTSAELVNEKEFTVSEEEIEVQYKLAIDSITSVVGEEKIEELKMAYTTGAYSRSLDNNLFKTTLASLNNQAQAYGFNDEQINAYIDG
ncbi:hypothetical protein [Schinkia azotoformans]|nr:hypothetical protein [Schinkia azotoformans]MEC1740896.1 hypothetical protein [Schinkia azotoformans]MEC1746647.1 hypothetical protein [Schinkia azotoformans]MEC1767853.1 hypothetical protein [Schinkia azotoformans]MEC1778821.1 hypothetical protein [Schinkia azotoformans]MED4375906.1 hypothetical protein [Schinkia azotoformans]